MMFRGLIIEKTGGPLLFYYFPGEISVNPVLVSGILSALAALVRESLGCNMKAIETEGIRFIMITKKGFFFILAVDLRDSFSRAFAYLERIASRFLERYEDLLDEPSPNILLFKDFEDVVKICEQEYMAEELREWFECLCSPEFRWFRNNVGTVVEALMEGKKIYVANPDEKLIGLLDALSAKVMLDEKGNIFISRSMEEIPANQVNEYRSRGVVIDVQKRKIHGKAKMEGKIISQLLKKGDIESATMFILELLESRRISHMTTSHKKAQVGYQRKVPR